MCTEQSRKGRQTPQRLVWSTAKQLGLEGWDDTAPAAPRAPPLGKEVEVWGGHVEMLRSLNFPLSCHRGSGLVSEEQGLDFSVEINARAWSSSFLLDVGTDIILLKMSRFLLDLAPNKLSTKQEALPAPNLSLFTCVREYLIQPSLSFLSQTGKVPWMFSRAELTWL